MDYHLIEFSSSIAGIQFSCQLIYEMDAVPIWRYLTLAKYVDLLRTKALYFPKASLFQDDTEGKWFGHALMYENSKRWTRAAENAKELETLLERAGDNPDRIVEEANRIIASKGTAIPSVLLSVLRDVGVVYRHKRREYLEHMIGSWWKHYSNHNQEVVQWSSELAILRESTYISCWNRASTMSLAMWELYGGGREAVAVRSTRDRLEALISHNVPALEQIEFEGSVADVQYVDGLKNPSEHVLDRIYQILEDAQEFRVGQFIIKSDIFEFEQEVRGVVYSKSDPFKPLEDPYPDMSGYSIPLRLDDTQDEASISLFIDAIYVHPTLGDDSMMVQSVREINNRFGAENIPIIADRIEALGRNVLLRPAERLT